MRKNLYFILLILFSVLHPGLRAEDSYTISLFATSLPRDSILGKIPQSVEIQKPLSPEQILSPSKPKAGSFIIRHKISDNTYGLFHGKISLPQGKNTFFSFSYPQSLTFEQILRTKIFSGLTDESDSDINPIIFGSDRIYLIGTQTARVNIEDYWIELSSFASKSGALFIESEPSDAHILIDGKHTDRTTPAVIEGISAGEHTVEVSIPEYLFSRKKVMVAPDSMITVSFKLISSVDTAYIEGTLRLGVLALPEPPIRAPFFVDGRETSGNQVTLNEGKHRVQWHGGERYSSLDTVVEVFLGKVTSFDFNPIRLTGSIKLIPSPADAQIFLGEDLLGYGVQKRTLPTGQYSFTLKRKGYYSKSLDVAISPEDVKRKEVSLEVVPDRDDDGFLDSLDKCPDEYGLYGGCPKPPFSEAAKLNARRILRNMREDPLSLSINSFSFLYRQPTNKRFRHALSYFSDGKNYLNNLKGISVGNSYTFSMHGFIASLNLGQWNSGLLYEKGDTLKIQGKSGTGYAVVYDSISGLNPMIVIPSTALSAGVHFITNWFNFGYLLGYQWEDIVLYDLTVIETGERTNVRFNNDWWFHTFLLETEFAIGEWFSPTLYTSFSLPLGSRSRTGWHVFETGIRFRFTPSTIRKRTEKYTHKYSKESDEDD